MSNLKANVIYSSILTIANYVFPFVTYPYISRVLGVTNIGICNFIDSIINYYIIFSMMGIGAVAIREISRNKDNKEKLSNTFNSILALNTISTAIVLIILFLSIILVPRLYIHRHLMYIGAFKVLFNYLLIEWFYTGTENFKYITKRSIAIKLAYIICIFAFVRKSEDYNIYYLLSMLMIATNAILNLNHSRKYICFSLSNINIKPYIRSFFLIGIYVILTSMYTTFNITFLGFTCGEKEVGIYTTATKLHAILLALFTAFTNVMMPHMSSLISKEKKEDFIKYINQSIQVLLLFAIPIVLYFIIYAPEIIYLIAGPGYESASTPMRIVMPLIFIIGYEQIGIMQILMPLKKDKEIFRNSVLGAGLGIIANIILVSYLKSVGSAIVWTISEIAVLSATHYYVTKYTSIKFPIKNLFKYILGAIPCIILLYAEQYVNTNYLFHIINGFIICSIYYSILYMFIFKEEIVLTNMNKLRKIFLK